RAGDVGNKNLRAAVGLAELDLHARELDGRARRTDVVRQTGTTAVPVETNMNITDDKIPNNVNLSGDRRLQRALEAWQPHFIDWWKQMGPVGWQERDVYLRTAVSVETDGWAHFDYVKMPDYRWGIFLEPRQDGRTHGFGDFHGQPVWDEVPGEFRNLLRRLVVTQGDTEPASVEQQRDLG